MKAALKAVEDGQSVNGAARDYGIPKMTLFDRVSGRMIHGVKPGPRPYLSPREEGTPGHFLDAVNKETMDHSLLYDTLSTHDLLKKPSQIYNIDESSIPLNPRPSKVVSAKGRKTESPISFIWS